MNLPAPELPSVGILSHLAPEERSRLQEFGEVQRIEAGQALIHEGQGQENLYIVISGSLSIRRANTHAPIAMMQKGDSIGEVNIFDPDVASASVIAMESSVIWKIGREGLRTFLNEAGDRGVRFLVGLITIVSQRLRGMNASLDEARPNAPICGVENWLG